MNILSLSRPRYLCGIDRYAHQLGGALAVIGHNVEYATAPARFDRIQDSRFDAIIVHNEIGEDLKNGDALRLAAYLYAAKRPARRQAVYAHSVFAPDELSLRSGNAREVACAVQYAYFHLLAHRATIVATTPTASKRLTSRTIANAMIALGSYRTPSDTSNARRIALRRDGAASILTIGLVGHPYASKHFELGIDAFASMDPPLRARCSLVILGGNPAVDPAAWAVARKSLERLSPNEYRVTGPLESEDFEAELDAIDIALLPYEGRTSASAVLSELSARRVCLVTSVMDAFDRLHACGAALGVRGWPHEAARLLERLVIDSDLRESVASRLAAANETGSITNSAYELSKLLSA